MKEHRRQKGVRMPFRNLSSAGRGPVRTTARAIGILVLCAGAVGAAAAYSIIRRGLSAHDEPSYVEATLARAMRRLATPTAVRARPNPVQASDPVIEQALAHYADHCAVCHANDGSGDTSIGRGLYPKVPDMRLTTTQSLTDGELFSIIEHGIRLTGMPAWGNGTPEGERDSWSLVHFIRRLPTLSSQDVERIDALTPTSRTTLKEEEEIRRFLSGESADTSAEPTPHH